MQTPSVDSEPQPTRVMYVDDSRDITDTLAMLTLGHADLETVGTLDSTDGIVEEVLQRRAGVLVLDLTIPGESPLEAIRELAKRAPSCRVIVYSGYDDDRTRDAALRAGAWALVSKRDDPDEIIRAIRRVAGERAAPAPLD